MPSRAQHSSSGWGALALVAGLVVFGCGGSSEPESGGLEDNPYTEAKAELGRYLFYDARLSVDSSISCGSCHFQELGFADGIAVPTGATGEVGPRNSPGLANVGDLSPLTWSAPALTNLELQIQVPMFGEVPVELGLSGYESEILGRLRAEPRYQSLFAAAFPGDEDPFTTGSILYALASFCRGLESRSSPYDRYLAGDAGALDEAQKRGLALFESERLGCSGCHEGVELTRASGLATANEDLYFNMGLYDIDGLGAYPTGGEGLFLSTFDTADMGKMRIPPLRNVAVTGPYMHDGSDATLDEVIEIYEAGGRNVADGPLAGDGRSNPYKATAMTGFDLSAAERADLLRFFDALTDSEFLVDPRFASPW